MVSACAQVFPFTTECVEGCSDVSSVGHGRQEASCQLTLLLMCNGGKSGSDETAVIENDREATERWKKLPCGSAVSYATYSRLTLSVQKSK